MGLDFVEILMQVESSFEISIPFDTPRLMERCQTVGGLYELIVEQLPLDSSEGYLTGSTFYAVRRALISITGADRRSIRPKTYLCHILPLKKRRRNWNRLMRELEVAIPGLEYPDGLALFLVLVTFIFVLVGTFVLVGNLGIGGDVAAFVGVFGGIAGFIGSVVGGRWLTRPLRLTFPCRIQTVGDLTRIITARNYGAIGRRKSTWHPQEVWSILQRILTDILGVRPEKIRPEARLVEDLGMS